MVRLFSFLQSFHCTNENFILTDSAVLLLFCCFFFLTRLRPKITTTIHRNFALIAFTRTILYDRQRKTNLPYIKAELNFSSKKDSNTSQFRWPTRIFPFIIEAFANVFFVVVHLCQLHMGSKDVLKMPY